MYVKMTTMHSSLKDLKLKVIEQVRKHPELYDLTHPRSKDTPHKDEIYDIIGSEVGCPGSDVKFLFSSLRKEYSNQRSLYETKLEQGDPESVPEPTWAFWKHMYFLRDTMQKRKRVSRSKNIIQAKRYTVQPSTPGPSVRLDMEPESTTQFKSAQIRSTVPVTLVGSTLVPILPKPTPTQYVQIPGGDSNGELPEELAEEKSSKDFGIDVSKYLVIQSGNLENTSMSEQPSMSPSGNGFDTSQSSDEDTGPQWTSIQVSKDPLDEAPSKRIKLENSEMSELSDAIRSMSSALTTNALKMSDVCQHPDICSLGRYVTSQIQLFPKNVQLDLEADILRLIMTKKKEFFTSDQVNSN